MCVCVCRPRGHYVEDVALTEALQNRMRTAQQVHRESWAGGDKRVKIQDAFWFHACASAGGYTLKQARTFFRKCVGEEQFKDNSGKVNMRPTYYAEDRKVKYIYDRTALPKRAIMSTTKRMVAMLNDSWAIAMAQVVSKTRQDVFNTVKTVLK